VRQAVDDRTRNRVLVRELEDERRERAEVVEAHLLRDVRARELDRRGDAEVRGHALFEHRLRAAAVLAARRRLDRGETDVRPAAPVAAHRAERGEPHTPSVRRDPDAVDPGPAGDGDPPPSLRARAEHGERVVPDDDAPGKVARLRGGAIRLLLVVEVDAGEQEHRQIGAIAHLVDEAGEDVQAALEAKVVGRALRPAHRADHLAVLTDEDDVRLRVAAVDGEDGPQRTASSAIRSSRPSTSSSCPISGCASSALRMSVASRVTAARAVSRSYAAVCCTSPSISGGSGSCGSGLAPFRSTRAGTSTTSSSARPASVSSFRTSTSCTAPSPLESEATRPSAASL